MTDAECWVRFRPEIDVLIIRMTELEEQVAELQRQVKDLNRTVAGGVRD